MYKSIFLFLVTFSFGSQLLFAQQKPAVDSARAHNVFVELGGAGLTISANYDTRFFKKRNGLGGRIGAGYIASSGDKVLTLPVGLNYLLGKGKNFFEVGVGATYLNVSSETEKYTTYSNGSSTTYYYEDDSDGVLDFDESGVIGTLNFGYRLQPIDSGFSFRGSFNPIFGYGEFIPFFGLSLGYTF